MAEALRDGIPNAALVALSPAAHLLAVEQPARVAAELQKSVASSIGPDASMMAAVEAHQFGFKLPGKTE